MLHKVTYQGPQPSVAFHGVPDIFIAGVPRTVALTQAQVADLRRKGLLVEAITTGDVETAPDPGTPTRGRRA